MYNNGEKNEMSKQRIFMHGKLIFILTMFFLLALGYANAQSPDEQTAKFDRLFKADVNSFVEWATEQQKTKGKDWSASFADVVRFFQPKEVTGKNAFAFLQTAELGKPFWFKIRALYKGYDNEEKGSYNYYFEDLPENKQATTLEATLTNIFGINTYTFTVSVFADGPPQRLKEPNMIATLLCHGVRFSAEGQNAFLLYFFGQDDPVALFDSSKFVLANNLKYISAFIDTKSKAENDRDIMMSMALSGAITPAFLNRVQGNQSPNSTPENVFDPVRYQKGELLDARSALNKKDIRNENTLPRLRVKFVSEVIFRGQSNTTVTVSTPDNAFTERMEFLGRSSNIKTGDKIRIYYTIAKDPLEKWEVHALERL